MPTRGPAVLLPLALLATTASTQGLVGWSSNTYGQCDPPGAAAEPVMQVGAGCEHSLLRSHRGSLTVVGHLSGAMPPLPPGLTYIEVSTGGTRHVAALRSGGSVVAWGTGSFGETRLPQRGWRGPPRAANASKSPRTSQPPSCDRARESPWPVRCKRPSLDTTHPRLPRAAN